MFSSNKTNDVVFISIISRKIQGFQSQVFSVNHGRSYSNACQKIPVIAIFP
ncbi:Hypothetical protein CpCap5W_1457 [Corynebacterium pseudotuberculosis]|nr:Hypothetical protein Cp3995_1252 [Corynebacterium pseudotuberculosis 3/99-5]AFH52177.1 Hypothetical protein Cp267_1278 [Corynebacterium pseudotuberculosis 267]AIG10018.1 hypothetical protein CPTB_01962 [Corynebacterium pseudotuberculosis]AKC73986.1 Hypothetical protein Cp226_1268 [Corynebacterium pseudotuberculosis]AKP08884.2 Hypothetical protein Cp262_1221 [Corynebacterium pseudotuberculosis]